MLFQSNSNNVIETAEDSANGKWSASSIGYYEDKYIDYFISIKSILLPHQNLSYYIRHHFVKKATEKFFSIFGSESQVVVIGGGYDTLFWLLRDEKIHLNKWIELDKEELISKKYKIILQNECLRTSSIQSESFQLQGIDFNTLSSNFLIELKKIGFDEKLPSLFIDEFSMIYLEIESFKNILNEVGHLKNAFFVSYGMTQMNDEYGTFVKDGFEQNGIPLKSYPLTSEKNDFIQLLLNSGFDFARILDTNSMLKYYFNDADRKKFLKLEHFNNSREMLYYMKHYYGALAGNEEFISVLPIIPV